jgi:hypothetical protein
MADEVVGIGTTFAGTALTAILTVRDIEGPNEECDDVDVSSNIDATGRHSRRFRPGFSDPGEIKVTVVFTKTAYAAALTNYRVQQAFTITAEDGSTIVTTAESYVKSISPSFPWEEEAVFDLVIKVSGDSTFTPAVLLRSEPKE